MPGVDQTLKCPVCHIQGAPISENQKYVIFKCNTIWDKEKCQIYVASSECVEHLQAENERLREKIEILTFNVKDLVTTTFNLREQKSELRTENAELVRVLLVAASRLT